MFKFFLFILFVSFQALAYAKEFDINPQLFHGYEASFVVKDLSDNKLSIFNPSLSQQRLAPCSTFKIYNALIGLELGLLKSADAPWYKWDGVKRDIEGWNKDLTLREAFNVSAVPAFQGLARQIGFKRMKYFMNRLGYGSGFIDAGIDIFWLNRPHTVPIRISSLEQVALIEKLVNNKLSFKRLNMDTVKDIMRLVQTDRGVLYGKTGSSMDDSGKWDLGWFVGYVYSKGNYYVFACHIAKGEAPFGRTARALVEAFFKEQGLL